MWLSKKPGRKIDFLIAGTQKGGTSALDHYLRLHPDIGMADKKELHFFDNEDLFSKHKLNYSEYNRHFDFKSNKKVYGESTPIYMYWKASSQRILDYNPKIKLIFILRNPIERAFSHWNMEFDRKAEKNDFSYCIRNENQRLKEALPFQHRVFSYVDRGFYANQIKRFKELFNEEQLMFIKYEDFNSNQENVLNKLFDFINVDSGKFQFERRTIHKRNTHGHVKETDKKHLIELYKNDIQQVETLLNWNCEDWFQ